MPTVNKSAAKASAVKEAQLKVVELVRRQGIYTGTLQISDVNEVKALLDGFEGRDALIAKQGAKATEIEFQAKGGRSGKRDYCLRLPNIAIEGLKKIGFEKAPNIDSLYTSK